MTTPAVVLVELLADDPHGHVGLAVEQGRRRWPSGASASIWVHCCCRRATSRSISSALTPSAAVRTMMPWPLGSHPVEDGPQALALVVGQPLGDAVGRAVGDQHHEPAGDRHLLGEAGALVGDRVLGDLADDRLLGLEQLLDAGVGALLLDVLGLVLDVAAVEHGVLGGADVDEGRLHARQHVLHLPQVDVAVDLGARRRPAATRSARSGCGPRARRSGWPWAAPTRVIR